MDILKEVLPIIIYMLLIVLLIVGIILGIKLIFTMNKVDELLEDVNKKVKSLDKVFSIIDFTTDRLGMIGDIIVNLVSSTFNKVFKKKKNKKVKVNENE